ncbi:hypothetical protein RclHR1_20960001 [Rhizophagus clarus]|uniref:Uncharacterized protein n=1 Tax=Rhizophagus clarus TaxID=94130 RepID=A0A2Z6R5A7_9GLOM|nr:hypothetical protein RclHR1_20960001 [Rhizophagus clarus]
MTLVIKCCFNSCSTIIFLSNLAITSSCKSDLSSSISHDSNHEESSWFLRLNINLDALTCGCFDKTQDADLMLSQLAS